MKWTKLTIDTTCEAEDLISAFLEEEGVLGVQIEDNIPLTEEEMETMFVDLLPDDMPENDGTAKVSCFLDDKGSRSVLVPHDDLPDKNAGHNQEAQNSHYYGFLYAWLFHLDIPYEQKGHQKHNDSVYQIHAWDLNWNFGFITIDKALDRIDERKDQRG